MYHNRMLSISCGLNIALLLQWWKDDGLMFMRASSHVGVTRHLLLIVCFQYSDSYFMSLRLCRAHSHVWPVSSDPLSPYYIVYIYMYYGCASICPPDRTAQRLDPGLWGWLKTYFLLFCPLNYATWEDEYSHLFSWTIFATCVEVVMCSHHLVDQLPWKFMLTLMFHRQQMWHLIWYFRLKYSQTGLISHLNYSFGGLVSS